MTPSKIKDYAEKHGVEFWVDGVNFCWSIECWAPDKKLWKVTGTHFLALPGDGYYTRPNWKETHAALKEAIEFGFEDCGDQECDVCHG